MNTEKTKRCKPQLKNPTVALQKLYRLRNDREKIPENCKPGFLIRSVKTGSTSFVDVVVFFLKKWNTTDSEIGEKNKWSEKIKTYLKTTFEARASLLRPSFNDFATELHLFNKLFGSKWVSEIQCNLCFKASISFMLKINARKAPI